MSLYPNIKSSEPSAPLAPSSTTSEARKNFIYFVVDEKQEKMRNIVKSMEKSTKKVRKATKVLGLVGSACGSFAVASSGASFATALSGVGIIVSVPLSILSGTLSLISVVSSAVNEKLHSILEKKDTLLHIATTYKINMDSEVGRALSNENIDTEEYSKILMIYQDFVNRYQSEHGHSEREGTPLSRGGRLRRSFGAAASKNSQL